MIHCW